MRPFFLILPALLAGCEKPEIGGCEEFIKSTLRSPSSFARKEVFVEDRKITWAERLKTDPKELQILKQSYDEGRYGERTVMITYDAMNPFGALLRETQMCKFSTRDGEVSDQVQLAVNSAIARRGLWSVLPPEKAGPDAPGCCS
jgi:hypothetical protein